MECPFVLPEGATVESKPHRFGEGVQHIFKFPNGWGASVVRFLIHGLSGSYGAERGLWELAVLDAGGNLNYEHPVANGDVLGYLSESEVNDCLARIAASGTLNRTEAK